MNASKKSLALVMGSALAVGVSMAPAAAAENPFALKPLASGYMVADNHAGDKMEDGKCGAGKCGGNMKKKSEKAKEGACSGEKAKEGSCSGDKGKEGNCSAEKGKDGDCGSEKK
jgi:uncharacterized low-complexity protein